MQIVWETHDVICGARLVRPGAREEWMIGYAAGTLQTEDRYSFVSLSDGLITDPLGLDDFTTQLNQGGYWPSHFLEDRK